MMASKRAHCSVWFAGQFERRVHWVRNGAPFCGSRGSPHFQSAIDQYYCSWRIQPESRVSQRLIQRNKRRCGRPSIEGYSHRGSPKMGVSPESCFLNGCLWLWHAPNVKVTDVSTFSENESANPVPPILVLTRQEIRNHVQNI